jgi:hypothetical protein
LLEDHVVADDGGQFEFGARGGDGAREDEEQTDFFHGERETGKTTGWSLMGLHALRRRSNPALAGAANGVAPAGGVFKVPLAC